MAFLIVNGVEFPYPKRGVKPTVIDVVDSGRNANGAVVGQKVGREQYKLDTLEYPWLDAATWEMMLKAVEPFFVPVTFPTMKGTKTIIMYPGNRTAEPYWIDDSDNPTHYMNCKFNLVDSGK